MGGAVQVKSRVVVAMAPAVRDVGAPGTDAAKIVRVLPNVPYPWAFTAAILI